jgi:molybdopterin converting factor small subunit
MMRVAVFGRAKDLLGSNFLIVDNPLPKTVGELRRQVSQQYPNLAGLVLKSGIAVNHEFANDDTPISTGAEVALLPPVSGG